METPEYIKVPIKYFPQDIQDKYHLQDLVHNDGYVYICINKGMYGLKQAVILAYKQLSQRLIEAGYYRIEGSTGMWKHITRKTVFCLCVDDFGVKYFRKNDAERLLNTIGKS